MNVLIVERPGAFRDALVDAVRARGAAVHAADGALDALGRLRELAPRMVVVCDGSGPPDVASTARLVRRQLGEVAVYHLHDPAAGANAPDTRPLSRHDAPEILARALIEHSLPPSDGEVMPLDELLEPSSGRPKAPPAPPAAALRAAAPQAPPAPETPAASEASDAALFAEVEPLMHQGRWQEVLELCAKREADPQRLSPRLSLLYAVALKEAPAGAAGPRSVDPDLLGVRAVAALLRLDGESTTALMIAKRVLRKRPLEWQREPPRRVSIVLTLVALALGAAAGLAFNQHLIRLLFG